jgi:hypothetical protein
MQHIEETLIDQYAMGILDEESSAKVEEHVLFCEFCQNRLRETDEFLAMFRPAAIPMEDFPVRRRVTTWPVQRWIWSGVAFVIAVFLIAFATINFQRPTLSPAIVVMQSVRGPEAGAKVAFNKPTRLVFDLALPNEASYEIDIVDTTGRQILQSVADRYDGHPTILIEKLKRGSYWARVFDKQRQMELIAEYSLTAE